MSHRGRITRLLGGAAAVALLVGAGAARAEDIALNIAAQPLGDALNEFAVQSKHSVVFAPGLVAQKTSRGVSTAPNAELALAQLLDGTGLSYRSNGDTFLIVSASDPQSGSAAGDGAEGTVQALIVTAQKREENIQDVPIAMSAFTQEDLTRSQVAGGPDLMTQVPNFTFTKTNFTGYSIQIRGIGTQAISATTDAAVAVAENNTPFIRNRFFEQEFYDLQRVEVLRGPQGTLYGRNATAGVVNIITAKPSFHYEAKLSADVGNFNSTRFEGMINLPLVEDKVALRIAGAWTKRDGYDTNQITGNRIDGRNLWSTRVSLRFEPTDNVHANLIWEHFNEDDDRLRSGKQLCKTDEVTNVAGFATTHDETLAEWGQSLLFAGVQGTFSQGCTAASLYAPESFQTPNGLALPYYLPLSAISLPVALSDPYVSRTQSKDLRVIESAVDPQYRAKSDVAELQFSVDLGRDLTLTSETGYNRDTIFSMEDFNRFNTAPGAWLANDRGFPTDFVTRGILSPEGIFCDPQIGCSDRLVGIDLSTAKSTQFSQELRLSSSYDGPFNFSLGANFLRYDTEDKYYVFFNSLTMYAVGSGPSGRGGSPYVPGITDNTDCLRHGMEPPNSKKVEDVGPCVYLDPNPIGSLNDLGHNYFLSRNPYKLVSYAVFGEAYYNLTDQLKLTAGLRWTVDKKEAPRIPSWVLGSQTAGYSVAEVVEQEWREPTGRLALDWKPKLAFTDETLLYASYAHGYKAGGANPPAAGAVIYCSLCQGAVINNAAVAYSAAHPKTFAPEFVNAFELGSKNTLANGRVTLNGNIFYYDYTGYQISQIVDRSAVNLNFDAKVWGAELESDWRPLENLRLGLKLGYERTRVDDGAKAIDLMDRTAGNPDWVLVRPFPTFPSNCILPAWLFVGGSGDSPAAPNDYLVNVGGRGGGNMGGCEFAYFLGEDPVTGLAYTPYPYRAAGPQLGEYFRTNVNYAAWNADLSHYPGWPTGQPLGTEYPGFNPATILAMSNNGVGFFKQLGGKELPNAPHITATLTTDYTIPLPSDWLMTLHTDLYYQSEAWTRIFNTPGYDKLKAYTNVNLAAIFSNEDAGWKVMAYVKNVFDHDSITGAFLNSDDTGLTTNVFLNEPRLYGLRVTKDWTGQGWWTGANPNHIGPYPLTVELAGMAQKQDAPYETLAPDFVDTVPPGLSPIRPQHRDLDWGDGRELKLTYHPGGSWSVAADVRYGRANNGTTRLHDQKAAGPAVCPFLENGPVGYFCDPSSPNYNPEFRKYATNWSDSSARDHEEHLIADFMIGRDFGLGELLGGSKIQLGLRYAHLKSSTNVTMDGTLNWNLRDGWYKYPSTADHFSAAISSHRDFKGAGPMLSWDAAAHLLGDEHAGHVDLDWSVGGGVLFGKQKAAVSGTQAAYPISAPKYPLIPPPYVVSSPAPLGIAPRNKSVAAPVLDLSLGLAYEIQRIKVGAGYRWERYYNAIDAGYTEHKSYDRTLDGPYFKIAVGFGG